MKLPDPRASKRNVSASTLDSVIFEIGPSSVDIIKIDVEGAEVKVLDGAMRTVREFAPLLCFEVNPAACKCAETRQECMFRVLSELGYRRFYDVGDASRGTKSEVPNVNRLTNILAVPYCRESSLEERLFTGHPTQSH